MPCLLILPGISHPLLHMSFSAESACRHARSGSVGEPLRGSPQQESLASGPALPLIVQINSLHYIRSHIPALAEIIQSRWDPRLHWYMQQAHISKPGFTCKAGCIPYLQDWARRLHLKYLSWLSDSFIESCQHIIAPHCKSLLWLAIADVLLCQYGKASHESCIPLPAAGQKE